VSDLVWYASYGSNMSGARFSFYLRGGQPPFAARSYPGARDGSDPRASRGVHVPGRVYFANESSVWGGGVAFLNKAESGESPARAYLVTVGQFCDIAAQETNREVGSVSVDMAELLERGGVELGPDLYGYVVLVGHCQGMPVVTFTASQPVRPLNDPSPRYLQLLARGLYEGHNWSVDEASRYLASLPGSNRRQDAIRRLVVQGGHAPATAARA